MSSAALTLPAAQDKPVYAASSTTTTTSLEAKEDKDSDVLYTVNDLLVHRARTAPDVPLVSYPASESGLTDYVDYTARMLDGFAEGTARGYLGLGLAPNDPFDGERTVVALLAPSDIDYIATLFGLQRLGFSVLLLSNRLSAHAVSALLTSTKCTTIITTPAFAPLLTAVRAAKPALRSFTIIPKSTYAAKQPHPQPRLTLHRSTAAEAAKIAFIVHSSGSTGLPKPIFQTHAACLFNYSSSFPLRGFITLPLYHNHGISSFMRAVFSSNVISFFNPGLPLTGANLATAMEHTRPQIFYGVPYALKVLAETPRGIAALRSCQLVLFGGSSCPDELGDRLVAAGVSLVGHYGATETGQLMTSFRPAGDDAWNYVRVPKPLEPYLLMDRVAGSDAYEVVVRDGWKAKVCSNSDDPPNSFRTRDLFVKHAAIEGAWKYLGRIDDRVTLVNGEKVLPIPIEGRVREHPLVKECVVFGIGKSVPGILLIPSEHAADMSDDEIRDSVWPAIEDANTRAESFSQISKEMVGIVARGVDYPSTDKGTVIRAAFYKQFEPEISAIYAAFENTAEGTLVLDIPGLETFLLSLFKETGVELESTTSDFFLAGVDSLRAISVWNKLKKTLSFSGNSGKLSQIVVFEQPNVQCLARYLYALRTGSEIDVVDDVAVMKRLVEKYSVFEPHVPGNAVVDGETVILTGTTGSLGAHILAQILPLESVKRVYCLVRAPSPAEALTRVHNSLAQRSLQPSPAQQSKATALPSDFSRPDLGLDAATLSHLRNTLTAVVHSAWAVNFNMGVASFETHHIAGAHNFLRLCLSVNTPRPARFFFCSSISAAAGTPLPARIKETQVPELAHAQGMGYARSKLVTERIVGAAASKTGVHARVLRIGQIVGDSKVGVWSGTEAIPLMLRSAVTLGVLPDLDETPSWMPVDTVAQAVLELSGLSCPLPQDTPTTVYHVLNPQVFSWTHDLLPALRAAGLEFEVVPQREWVQRLRDGDQDPVRNPTVKLTRFFEDKYDNDMPGRKGLEFETEVTRRWSPAVGGAVDVVEGGLVERFVKRWTEGGW
ncbi:uncharacterized protein H6S33_001032 [Morchella sextelata]|uniref:uncharacterized protein n=1 Tax=Morchella sextelata TaxID=1174677 RepID=UPI001D03C2CC|nr:uncharacterized protein H6S33_001032 [Morchella sextelata]KAH0608804.1 hypothetical protein H6S33_001032 [Morchella sextelata]